MEELLYGTDPVTAVVVLQSIGADIIGVNCSTGPGEMIPVIKKMKEYAEVPILAKPNAGLPVLEDGVLVYPMTPEELASWEAAFLLKQVQDSSADAVALPQNIFECLLKKFRASQQKLHATYIQLCLLQRERVRNRS